MWVVRYCVDTINDKIKQIYQKSDPKETPAQTKSSDQYAAIATSSTSSIHSSELSINNEHGKTFKSKGEIKSQPISQKGEIESHPFTQKRENESYPFTQERETESYPFTQKRKIVRYPYKTGDSDNLKQLTMQQLKNLEENEANEIIIGLMNYRFKAIISEKNVNMDLETLAIILKLLSKAFSTSRQLSNQRELMEMLLLNDFFKLHKSKFLSDDFINKHWDAFCALVDIFTEISKKMFDSVVEMTLHCQKYKQITKIKKPGDFQLCGEKLPCGHYCRSVCHMTPDTKCEQDCIKEMCELKHTCPLKCYQICQPCRVLVLKYHLDCDHSEYHPCFVDIATIKCKKIIEWELKCEHKVPLECHVDVNTYECIVKVKRELPHCGHERVMKCHQDPLLVHCKVDCGARLDCGHVCPNKCHPLHDPEHENVECRKPCEKKCEREHKCQNLCYQPCNECLRFVEKQRSCGHKIQHPCSKEIIERPMELLGLRLSKDMGYVEPCNEPCTRTLPCTHPCEKKCYEPCGDCKVIVDKILVCGHVIKAECSASIMHLKCTAPCNKTLPCGHQCPNNCGGTCETKCTTPVTRIGLCGHNIDTPCYLKTASSVEIAQFCKHACNAQLECEHQCMGTCGECRQGRVHIPCKEYCGRILICGHSCTFPCATMCPPCNRKCSTQCVHSKCPKKCGQPCKKCEEKCRWQCEHHECMKKCGEICDREPCNEPCFKLLLCGHQCIGLCGEKCPKLCRVCNRDELLDFMLLGNEEDENARFLQLVDCGHCIEVEGMDYWMMVKTEEIKMKECPKCKTTIWKSYRYGNIIKQKMEQVQKVKKRVFGKERNLRKTMHQVHETIDHCRLLKTHFPMQIKKLVKRLTGKQAVHQNQLVVIQNQVNILTSMANIKDNFSRVINASEAKRYFESDLDFLVNRLMKNEEKMNEFEIQDIGKELTRIELYTMFLNIQETPKTATAVYHLNTAKRLLTRGHKLTNDEERDVEEGIKKAADYVPGLAITNTERLMIVKAVGLGAGRWFTCPNGHVYVIGECGVTMERSRCPECKAVIGGANHALERDNRHFGAMDGSSRPAWGNNTGIGNYDLNDVV